MSRIVVIAAMNGELAPLVKDWTRERRGGVTLWRKPFVSGPVGGASGDSCVAACAGAGGDAALRALAEAEKDAPADVLVSAGWAGALDAACRPGQAYRVSGVVDALGGERLPAVGGPYGHSLVSSPTVADEAEKRRLIFAHGAQLVDMEAAALARLAAQRGIPFYAVKGVSDGPGERLPDFGLFLDPDGRFRFIHFTAFALFRPQLWPMLLRLGRNSRLSAQSMAVALRDFLKV